MRVYNETLRQSGFLWNVVRPQRRHVSYGIPPRRRGEIAVQLWLPAPGVCAVTDAQSAHAAIDTPERLPDPTSGGPEFSASRELSCTGCAQQCG